MSHPLDSLHTVEDVERLATELYDAELPVAGGVLHVVSGWPDRGGEIRVLRLLPSTPASRLDSFVLSLARARAEAIVTTGMILRQEPDLRHELTIASEEAAGPENRDAPNGLLHEWRRRRGLAEAPLLAVLTSGRDVDLSHPAFSGWPRPMVFTSSAAARRLRGEMAESVGSVEVVGVAQPSLRRLIDFLLGERGCRTVSVEAGPGTVRDLYEQPLAVDELLLSLYRGRRPDEAVLGGPLPSLSTLDILFAHRSAEWTLREASGLWGFRRYAAGEPVPKSDRPPSRGVDPTRKGRV